MRVEPGGGGIKTLDEGAKSFRDRNNASNRAARSAWTVAGTPPRRRRGGRLEGIAVLARIVAKHRRGEPSVACRWMPVLRVRSTPQRRLRGLRRLRNFRSGASVQAPRRSETTGRDTTVRADPIQPVGGGGASPKLPRRCDWQSPPKATRLGGCPRLCPRPRSLLHPPRRLNSVLRPIDRFPRPLADIRADCGPSVFSRTHRRDRWR